MIVATAACAAATCTSVALPNIGSLAGKHVDAPHGARIYIVPRLRLTIVSGRTTTALEHVESAKISATGGTAIVTFADGRTLDVHGSITPSQGFDVIVIAPGEHVPNGLTATAPYDVVP